MLGHFEGWELGVIAVGIAAIAAALALPRGAEPDVIPLPRIDRKEVARMLAQERSRVEETLQDPLPYEVRAVGEVYRRYGRADATGDASQASLRRSELTARARSAREIAGDPALLRLRAVQTELFLAAIARWEGGAEDENEIRELGGTFLDKARSSGWLSGPRRLVLSLAERATLFRIRWVELVGLRDQNPFSPSANEWRIYYRFLLEHSGNRGDERLSYVAAVEKYDPEYPGDLARGIIELELGRPARAVPLLTAFLAKKPSGRWRLRAQNHLALALASVEPDPR